MQIYVLGNTLVKEDKTAVNLIPQLKKRLPEHKFVLVDPTENFTPDPDKPLVIIDAVQGIDKVQVFTDISDFSSNKAISVHDYDLFLHLQLLKKLGKLPQKLMIIGIPQTNPTKKLIDRVAGLIKGLD